MELQRKIIMNSTVTLVDKVMKAIADCTKAIKGVKAGNSSSKLRDLQQIVDLAKRTVQQNPTALNKQVRATASPAPRVQHITRVRTRSMTNELIPRMLATTPEQPAPRVPATMPDQPAPRMPEGKPAQRNNQQQQRAQQDSA